MNNEYVFIKCLVEYLILFLLGNRVCRRRIDLERGGVVVVDRVTGDRYSTLHRVFIEFRLFPLTLDNSYVLLLGRSPFNLHDWCSGNASCFITYW